jgi:glycosyltransferase involved in cell wall biosynthesis
MQRVTAPVLIDGRAAARPELGGVERWAREMAVRLPALNPARYAVAWPRPRLVHRAGHAWEQGPLVLRAARADLLLCPANLAPVAFGRTVVVIHDAAALRHAEWYSGAFVAWQRIVMPRVARRAVRVVTVSEFSRREVAQLLGVAATVVPGGVDERFTPAADPEPARRALGLARPYVLTLGSRTARKNLAVLGEAARRLGAQGVDLVAAGGDRPQFRPEAPVDGVREIGRVDEALLPGLYAGARAFVLPSRYEGFGLPCLEAMAAGVPVVAAAAGALPEVCGADARLADPDDPEGMAAAVLAAAADRDRGRRDGGLARAAAYSWTRTARELDAVISDGLRAVARSS